MTLTVCMIDDQNKTQDKEQVNESAGKDGINEMAGNENMNIENDAQSDAEAQDQVVALQQQLNEANDKFLRLYAEFDNYKRRTIKEKSEILQTAGKDVMLALLPVIDDFERAIKATENSTDAQAIKDGINLIHHKFANILSARGLKAIESIGQNFDTDIHEAITNIPAPNDEMKGKVIDETEKGYTLNGHVIRFAKVVVGE